MIPSGKSDPISPIIMPSMTNGERTKKSVAPIYFMIFISSFLTEIPMVTVLLIKKIDTANKIAIMPRETYAIKALTPLSVVAVNLRFIDSPDILKRLQ